MGALVYITDWCGAQGTTWASFAVSMFQDHKSLLRLCQQQSSCQLQVLGTYPATAGSQVLEDVVLMLQANAPDSRLGCSANLRSHQRKHLKYHPGVHAHCMAPCTIEATQTYTQKEPLQHTKLLASSSLCDTTAKHTSEVPQVPAPGPSRL